MVIIYVYMVFNGYIYIYICACVYTDIYLYIMYAIFYIDDVLNDFNSHQSVTIRHHKR